MWSFSEIIPKSWRMSSFSELPSGNLLHSYWKLPFIVDLPTKNGDFQQLFVCFPEGLLGFDPSSRVKICLPRVSPVGEPRDSLAQWVYFEPQPNIKISIGVVVLWILENTFLLTVYIAAYSTYACNCIYIIIQLCAKCKWYKNIFTSLKTITMENHHFQWVNQL